MNIKEIDEKIASLRETKQMFLSRMNAENKKDINYWTRQTDKEIRKYLAMKRNLML